MIGIWLRGLLVGLTMFAGLSGVAWATAPAGRYTVASGTVKDNKTGLTWQRLAAAPTTSYTWAGAKSYCTGLGSGWRLPTINELMTLIDFTAPTVPQIDTAAFPDTVTGFVLYWSSSGYVGDASLARAVSFAAGTLTADVATFMNYARCVR